MTIANQLLYVLRESFTGPDLTRPDLTDPTSLPAFKMTDQTPLILLVQQLQQELQNQRVEIQQLRTDLDASRTDVQQLRTQLLTSPVPRSRLPDPPRFNGKPYTLRTWLPSIKAKLRSDQLSGADAFDYV